MYQQESIDTEYLGGYYHDKMAHYDIIGSSYFPDAFGLRRCQKKKS